MIVPLRYNLKIFKRGIEERESKDSLVVRFILVTLSFANFKRNKNHS